jgi:hypothetical protein
VILLSILLLLVAVVVVVLIQHQGMLVLAVVVPGDLKLMCRDIQQQVQHFQYQHLRVLTQLLLVLVALGVMVVQLLVPLTV